MENIYGVNADLAKKEALERQLNALKPIKKSTEEINREISFLENKILQLKKELNDR